MNINVDRDSFLKAINIADSIISSKSVNTILSNCLFNILKDDIEIISTDNEIAIRTRISAVSESSGSFTANGIKLSSILKELPEDEVVLGISENFQIDIRSKSKNIKGHYKLIGSSSDEYPDIPEFKEKNSVEIEQPLLKEMIKKVIYAASSDTIKPVFNGMYFISDAGGAITAVATDSRRLSLISKKIGNDINIEKGIIIPLKTVNEVYRLLGTSGRCLFAVENNQCFFRIGETEIISRVVDGQFPNYKQVIPHDHTLEVVIEKRKFLESARRAFIFTREPAHKIVLHFRGDRLIMEASTPELGEAEEEIPVESNLEDTVSLGINAQFLIESLKEMDEDTIRCGITGHMSPVTISPENDAAYTAVIMPIQIKTQESD